MTDARLLVDGGGTTTRAALWRKGETLPSAELHGPSCNPRSVGRARALENLDELVRLVWSRRPAAVDSIDAAWLCLSTASTRQQTHDLAADLLALPSTPLRQAGALWISNDIAPLLVHDGRATERVVAICGTGTGFCAINPAKGRCARASGKEYLLADEGGGFDLGLQGLRAVIRQADGRGPRTSLTEVLVSWRGVSVEELYDLVHGSSEPKVLVSSFAPAVLAAAEEGDDVAAAIASRAADELLTGIRAVAARAALSGSFEVLLVGSNLVGAHAVLRDRLQRSLLEVMPAATVRLLSGSTLAAVANLAELLPSDERLERLLLASIPLLRCDPTLVPRPARHDRLASQGDVG